MARARGAAPVRRDDGTRQVTGRTGRPQKPPRRVPATLTGARGSAGRPAAHERFLRQGEDRARREWLRYEGTPQRELFRQLRERFLRRHAREGRWSLDAGSGPGRFLPWIGRAGATRVALDLSRSMLAVGRERTARTGTPKDGTLERVRGDALRPPFAPGAFAEVALVGNTLGFEGSRGRELLDGVEPLVGPGGVLVVEIAPGPGERSRYLRRLPPGAVRRLLAAPASAVLARLAPEGFAREPIRHRPASFRRWTVGELSGRWRPRGWTVREAMAVAPALGPDPTRLSEVARDPVAWTRLLDLEEQLGRDPARWTDAAAVLVAVASPAVRTNDFVGGPASSSP